MNTNHSRGDRAGVWDLPVLPALRYGLIVDEHHDERYAVEASTQAALQDLSDLHTTTGDWWETLLAYTNSPASVSRAFSACVIRVGTMAKRRNLSFAFRTR